MAVQPHQERTRRVDNTFTVWIQEAKQVAAKKTYFCELLLDASVQAKTSRKLLRSDQKTGSVFWGEWFEFSNLPDIEVLTVNVYREPDKKKKKENVVIGECCRLEVAPWEGLFPVECEPISDLAALRRDVLVLARAQHC